MGTSEPDDSSAVTSDQAKRQEDVEDVLQREDLKAEPRSKVPDDDNKDLFDLGMAGGSGGALAWLLRRTPTIDLFLFVAEQTRPGATRTARVIDLRHAHPWWYKSSFFADWLLRVLAAIALLLLVLAVAWKTLAPIPALPSVR